MALTKDQQTKIILKAKEKNPNITLDEAKALLGRAEQLQNQQTSSSSWKQQVGNNPVAKTLFPQFSQAMRNAPAGPNSLAELGQQTQRQMQDIQNPQNLKKQDVGPIATEGLSYLLPFSPTGKMPGNAVMNVVGNNAKGRVVAAGANAFTPAAMFGANRPENTTLPQQLFSGIKEGTTAALLAGLTQAGSEGVSAVKNAVKSNLKGRAPAMFAGTLKETRASEIAIKKHGGVQGLMKDAQKHKVPLRKDKLQSAFVDYQKEYNREVQKILAKNGGNKSININAILDDVERQLKHELKNPENTSEAKQALKYLEEAKKTYANQTAVSPESANRLRVRLDKELKYHTDMSNWSGRETAIKSYADALRQAVASEVPAINMYNSKYSTMADLLLAMKKEPAVGLMESIFSLTPAMAAGFMSPIAAIPSGAAAYGLTRTMRSPGMKRVVAQKTSTMSPKIAGILGSNAQLSIEALRRLAQN